LLVFPILIFNNILYPYPGTDEDDTIKALSNGFVAMDVLDMTELIFADTGCFQGYGTNWLVFFYIALGVSAILIPFSAYGLEQQKEDTTWKDITTTVLNMIFNDLFFFILRVMTMSKQGHMYTQSIFAIVEGISFIIRLSMLSSYFCDRDAF